MLNTNSTNNEPKVKELLLERRHSICLEVSKKRRQSVASSIFIPKDQPRSKSNFESEKKPILTARNKKSTSLLMNKRRNMVRLMSKKKLKRLTISNKNKRVAKVQTNPSSLKHPESYPIIKQTVSSEKVRCVVESLRDDKVSQGSTHSTDEKYMETCERSSEINLFEPIELTKEPKQAHIVKMDERGQVEERGQQPLVVSSNEPIQADSDAETINIAESEPSASDSDVQIMGPQINYTSMKRVDNFVIMVDASGAHVEIKYAVLPTSATSENEVVQTLAKSEGFVTAHNANLEEITNDYEELGYIEANNCAANTERNLVTSRFQSNDRHTNTSSKPMGAHVHNIHIAAGDVLRPNLLHSNKDDIIDLSIKGTAEEMKLVPVMCPSTSSELTIRPSMLKKVVNPKTSSIQPTLYRPNSHLLPAHQTMLPSFRRLNDRSHIFAKNASTSNSQTCCYHCCSTESPNHIANTPSKPLPSHYYTFSQQAAHLETSPISPRHQHWVPTPPKINFSILDLQQSLRNGSVSKASESFANSPINVMPNELTYDSFKNTLYPYAQPFQKQPPQRPEETRQLQPFGTHSFVTHHFDQLHQFRHSRQNKHLLRYRFPQQQYNHRQQNHLGYAYQMNSELDLPQQFYNPLLQSFLSNPNQSSTQQSFSTPNVLFEQKEPWRFPNRPNIIPQVRFDPSQAYLPPTPPTTAWWSPPEKSMPTNFPYSSPNWANTLYNCPPLSVKPQTCCNVQPHPYPNRLRLPKTELISRLHASDSQVSTTNALINRTNDNIWPSAHLHTQIPSTTYNYYL